MDDPKINLAPTQLTGQRVHVYENDIYVWEHEPGNPEYTKPKYLGMGMVCAFLRDASGDCIVVQLDAGHFVFSHPSRVIIANDRDEEVVPYESRRPYRGA